MTPVLVLVLRSPCALSAPRWTNYNNERKRNIKASIEAYYFFQQYTFLFVDNLHSLKKEEITCVDRTGGWGWGWVGRGSWLPLPWKILNLLNLHSRVPGNRPWTPPGKNKRALDVINVFYKHSQLFIFYFVSYAPIHLILTFRIYVRIYFIRTRGSFYSKIRRYLHTAKNKDPPPQEIKKILWF